MHAQPFVKNVFRAGLVILLFFPAAKAAAFNGHVVTQGPLKVTIADIKDVTEYDKPVEVGVTLNNSSDSTLKVRLHTAGLVDQWYAAGEKERTLELGPRTQANAAFRIAAARGAFSALYPVHIYATFQHQGGAVTAHAVQIFKSNFQKAVHPSSQPSEMPLNIVPANGALPLWSLSNHRVAWRYYDKPLIYMPIGWQGSVPDSAADFSRYQVARGATKNAIVMPPPGSPPAGASSQNISSSSPMSRPSSSLSPTRFETTQRPSRQATV